MARKYRPYFTLAELKTLANLSHSHSQTSALTRYLNKYVSDIESGFRSESITVQPDISTSLGFTPPIEDKTAWEKEQERRYLNNEMSPEEEKDYEKEQGRTV